jgi:hypothetical protein
MEKRMTQVKVYISDDNYICIEQDNFGNDDSIIAIHPEQVELLVKWLNEAKSNIKDS